jgi:hypothetical protein
MRAIPEACLVSDLIDVLNRVAWLEFGRHLPRNFMSGHDPLKRHGKMPMLDGKMFDVEHALNMYATSFVLMPASGIYDKEVVQSFAKNLATCHVYLIGLLPQIDLVEGKVEEDCLVTSYNIEGTMRELRWPMLPGGENGEEGWRVVNTAGKAFWPADEHVALLLRIEAH